jgi:gas vesicle protein
MHPDEPQTPDQELEQAFMAESGDEADDSPLTVDPWDTPVSETEAEESLAPLPELRLREDAAADPTPAQPEADIEEISVEIEATVEPEIPVAAEESETPATSQGSGPPNEPPENPPDAIANPEDNADSLRDDVARLQQQKQALQVEIQDLVAQKNQMISAQSAEIQSSLGRLVEEGLRELEQRKKELQSNIEQLERRRDRINEEMQTTFAGVSQNMAIRVQGFKDYLVGSFQYLAAAAEQLDLPELQPPRRETSSNRPERRTAAPPSDAAPNPQFARASFQNNIAQVRELLEQYRTRPDYYGPPWQLRRTFEPIHAERVSDWFLRQGGRGSLRSMGSRLQNILVASAAISILRDLYRDRAKVLVLANTPERLGEWRRGLQDCLGISRSDFGPSRGVVLFESPEALVQKAERLVAAKELPLIIIDDTEERIDLALLQFPLWLAFAPDPAQGSNYLY